MPSANKILALAAILALPAAAVEEKHNLRKNRRGQINHVNGGTKNYKKEEGAALEEDVEFFTNLIRRTQDMSIPMPRPTNPPVVVDPVTPFPTGGGGPIGGGDRTTPPVVVDPTDPPVVVTPFPTTIIVDPTDPPVGGGIPTLPPAGVVTNPPVPVVGVICAEGESCAVEGDICSDGTTEECCGETFDSFQCECIMGPDDLLVLDCDFTDACLDRECETGPPVSGPTPTAPPVPDTGGFKCPNPQVVGCTAVDPTNPVDECSVVGEPCTSGNEGEFCCTDGCPRNYCTAKQAPMSTGREFVPLIQLDHQEIADALEGKTDNLI